MRLRKKPRTLLALLTTAGLMASCGSSPTNVGEDDELARDAAYGAQTSRVWNALADFMGMGRLNEETLEGLIADLQKAPKIYSAAVTKDTEGLTEAEIEADEEAAQARFDAFHAAVGGKLVRSAIRTQCGEVVGITEARDGYFVNQGNTVKGQSKFHVMKYKLLGADGQPEDLVRQALISVPTTSPTDAPLIMYGHADAQGLAYQEIATLFGAMQMSAIIAAPSFNGEPIVSCDPTDEVCTEAIGDDGFLLAHAGTATGAAIYDDDAVEMLGLYSCVAGVFSGAIEAKVLKKSDYSATNATDNPFIGINTFAIPALGITTPVVPYTIFAGVDRGGFTAQLAAARAGLILADLGKGEESNITAMLDNLGFDGTFVRAMPQGVLALGSHASMTMGTNRIALQLMVQGGIEYSPIRAIPGFTQLGTYLKEMATNVVNASGSEEYQTELLKLAAEVAVRDLAYMGRYIPIAVREWKQGPLNGGSLALLHGVDNQAISYNQAQFADGIMKLYNANITATMADTVPTIKHHVFAFKAPESYFDENGAIKDLNHVANESFLKGELVGLAQANMVYVGNPTADGNSPALNGLANAIFVGSNEQIPAAVGRATLYPLFAREASYNAFNPSSDDIVKVPNVTPAAIAGAWLTYQAVRAGQ